MVSKSKIRLEFLSSCVTTSLLTGEQLLTKDEIEKLYEQYGSWIFNRARSMLKDEQRAHEAMQDVFLKILEVGDSFRGESSPWTWLYRITTNHCLNIIRSQKSWRKAFEGLSREEFRMAEEPKKSQDAVLIDKNWVVERISEEDPITQKILMAYFYDRLTQEEIVEELNISRKTVYKRLKKFMEKAKNKV